jgi:hypothetical protein
LPTRPWRWLATGAVALAIAPLLTLFAHPPTTYPDAGTRQVAALAGRVQDAAPPRQGVTPVLLPAAPSDSFNASYALRILSGHPDEWLITSDPQLFQAWVTTLQPRLWMVDTTTHATTPAAARVQQVAQYAVGWTAARAIVSVAEQPEPGQPAQAHGSGFAAGEPTSAWLTTPAGATLATAWQATTAADGTVTGAFTLPPSAAPGAWTLTVAGLQSGVTGTATFVLPAPAP